MAETRKNRKSLMLMSILLSTIFSAGYGLSTALMIINFAASTWTTLALVGITSLVAGIGGIVFLVMTIKPLYNILNKIFPSGGKLFGGYLAAEESFTTGQKIAMGVGALISIASGFGFAASAYVFLSGVAAIFPPLLIVGVAVIGVVMAVFVFDAITRLIKSGEYNPFKAIGKLIDKFKTKYHTGKLTTQQKVERFITYTIAIVLAATIIGLVVTSILYGGPMLAFLFANMGGASAAIITVASHITAGLYAIGRGLLYLADFDWWTGLGESIAKIPLFSTAGLTAIIGGAAILALGISTLGIGLAASFGALSIGLVIGGIVRKVRAKPEPAGQDEEGLGEEEKDKEGMSTKRSTKTPCSRLSEEPADNPDKDGSVVSYESPLAQHSETDRETEEEGKDHKSSLTNHHVSDSSF